MLWGGVLLVGFRDRVRMRRAGPHGCSSPLEGLGKAVHRCVFLVAGELVCGEGSATVSSWTTDAILSWTRRVVRSSGRLSCNCLYVLRSQASRVFH